MAVDLEGDGWVFMTKPVGYFDRRAVGFDKKAGVRVTQIMDAYLFHASLFCASWIFFSRAARVMGMMRSSLV